MKYYYTEGLSFTLSFDLARKPHDIQNAKIVLATLVTMTGDPEQREAFENWIVELTKLENQITH